MPQINQKQARNSALELLRIVAMLFIVLSHACVHSHFHFSPSTISLNSLFVQWGVLGNLGVDIYALISGYFLCKSAKSYRSVIRLLLQVWFYSYTLFLVCKFVFHYTYSSGDYLQVFFPTVFQEYWFFTAYVVLSLLAPYVNSFLSKADRITTRNLIITMLILWVIIPTLTSQNMYAGALAELLFFYIVGAYFRLYPDYVIRNKLMLIGITVFSFVLLFGSTVVINFLAKYKDISQNAGITFYSRNSLLTVMCAIGLFALFLNIPTFTNRFINTIAACTFGVYLIHDNPVVRFFVWMRVFRHAERFDSNFLIAQILASTILVFSVSVLIEYLRIKITGSYFDRLAAYIEKKMLSAMHASSNADRL